MVWGTQPKAFQLRVPISRAGRSPLSMEQVQSKAMAFHFLWSNNLKFSPKQYPCSACVWFSVAPATSNLHGTGTNNTEWEKAHFWLLGGGDILLYVALLELLKMKKQWALIRLFLAKYGLTLFSLVDWDCVSMCFSAATWKESYFYRDITHFPFIVIVLE